MQENMPEVEGVPIYPALQLNQLMYRRGCVVQGFSVGMIENEIAGSEKVLTYDDIACLKRGKNLARLENFFILIGLFSLLRLFCADF